MSDRAQRPEPDAASADLPAGDRERRLEELYRSHWAELVRFVTRTFGAGPPDPEDAAQAAFEHYAALAKPESIECSRSFLYRSARNYALDQKRRLKLRARYAANASADGVAEFSDDLDAERVLSAKERLRILDAAIRSMKPAMREVFILNRIHDVSYAELSRRMSISQTKLKRMVQKAVVICERALRDAERRRGGARND